MSVSSKYQVVIPKALRESAGIEPGQKVEVLNYNGIIQIVPVPNMQQSRGVQGGVINNFQREADCSL